MEHKSFPSLGLKVVDESKGIVEHVITVFGIIDYGKDISHPGSFTKTIAERGTKVLVLDQHRTDSVNAVLAKPLEIREVSRNGLPKEVLEQYPEATGGVIAVTQFLLETVEGRGAFIRIKEDAVREWSYGYDPLDVDFTCEEQGDVEVRVRNLRTIKLYEYSPVLWGMNPATGVISAKELGMEGKPYNVFEEDGEYCVYKVDEDGGKVGETLGCHPTASEAEDQIAAIHASEDEKEKGNGNQDEAASTSGERDEGEERQKAPDLEGKTEEKENLEEKEDPEGEVEKSEAEVERDEKKEDTEEKEGNEEKSEREKRVEARAKDPKAYYDAKAQSLYDLIEAIRNAFHDQFGYKEPMSDIWYWVYDIYEDHIILEVDANQDIYFYEIPYTISGKDEDQEISFSEKDEWIKGTFKFVPDEEQDAKSDRDTILSMMVSIPEGREEKVFAALRGTNIFNIMTEVGNNEEEENKNDENDKNDENKKKGAGPSVSSPTSRKSEMDSLLQSIDIELSETENILEVN